jgi:heme/copper-type cytochrome/quinol oxidase subunit 2
MEKEKKSELTKADIPSVSIADWLITLFILVIPVLNLVMLLVWSFKKSTHPSKSNFSKAVLIWILITILLWTIILTLSGVTLFEILGENPDFIDNPF